MSRRSRAEEKRIVEAEAEFVPLLAECLRSCAAGEWGLSGQNGLALVCG